MYKFRLPLPPSINNNKWVNPKTGRIIHKNEVRKWKDTARILLNHVPPQTNTEWGVNLEFHFYYKNKKRRIDTDNRLKPIFDAIAERLRIDDSLLSEYHVIRKFIKGAQNHCVVGEIFFTKGEKNAEKKKENRKEGV